MTNSNTTPKPDLFWNASDPETSYNSIEDALEYGREYFDTVVEIRRAAMLPSIWAVRVEVDDVNAETYEFATEAEATAWVWAK